ncbi:MAG TPA: AMP-binding protein [Blastocatellia bacterium]|nr:AMP-binding protein [Blastocatellia bacterium]
MQSEHRGREVAYQQGVLSLMQMKAEFYSDRAAFHHYEDGAWRAVTYAELASRVRSLSDYLIESRFTPGDRITILSESRPEWAVALLASVRCGAIVVPLDTKLTATELLSILRDAEPRLLFVSAAQASLAGELKAGLPFLESVFLLNSESGEGGFTSIDKLQASQLQEGVARGVDETSLIVYTSGTMGEPKGVMISFKNLGYQIMNFEEIITLDERDMLLSMLPLNHLLELTCGLLGALYAGGRITYCSTLFPQEIAQIMRDQRVTCMITVPLFLKMLKASIEKEVARRGPASGRLFRAMLQAARWIKSRRLRKLLFKNIHDRLGGRLRAFISGGAPLDAEVEEFFDRLGIPIYQGYGLTETSPVISVNTPSHNRAGSVGRPLPGVRVRLLENGTRRGEGEILTAGPHVMKGYFKREDLTREAIDEQGWFKTGDLGRVDEDGFLYITGRAKNLIVLGSGKKVNPEDVEAALSESHLIKEVCVVGLLARDGLQRGQEEICAVVVPHERGGSALDMDITEEVNRLSATLAPFKRPTNVIVRHEDLPRTSTRKVKRALVTEWVESMQKEVAGRAV